MIVKNTFDMSIKFLLLTFIGLNFLNESWASDNNPAISLGVTYCKQVYLIQIYDSGWVEYRGLRGVKTLGRRQVRIKPSVVNDLLKQAEDNGLFLADNRMRFIHWNKIPYMAIHIKQNEKSATILESKESESMQSEILKIKEISKLVGNEKQVGCVHDDGVSNNYLKLEN